MKPEANPHRPAEDKDLREHQFRLYIQLLVSPLNGLIVSNYYPFFPVTDNITAAEDLVLLAAGHHQLCDITVERDLRLNVNELIPIAKFMDQTQKGAGLQ